MEKILIIDDDPDILFLLQHILSKNGFIVSTAVQEQQVYAKVASENPDLILMDVLLSGSDGRMICRKLKSSAQGHIPIIIFSGHPGAQKNFADCGANDFLPKPIQEKALLEKVARHLTAGKQVG